MELKKVNVIKKSFYILILLSFSLTSCKLFNSTKEIKMVKATKGFTFSIKSDIPDQKFSVDEAKSDASFLISKANQINKVNFKLIKIEGNLDLSFSNEKNAIVSPVSIFETKSGFLIDFKYEHSDENFRILNSSKIIRMSGKGLTMRDAFRDAFTKVAELNNKNRKEYKLIGNMTLANIEELQYSTKDVKIVADFIVNVKEISVITKDDIANSYGDRAILALQKRDSIKAEELIKKGLSISNKCDKCHYAAAINAKQLKIWNYSIQEINKAISINKNNIRYYQFLQTIYMFLYENMKDDTEAKRKLKEDFKRKAWINEGYMKKHFNSDGSVIEREKAPISKTQPKFKTPTMKTTKLDNGLTITEIPKNDLPLFQISIGFNLGTSHNKKGKMGTIKAMFSLLTEGVEGMTSKDIANYLDNNGLYLWHSVSGDYSTLNCASLTENSDKCIFLLDKLINNATFPEDEFKKYITRTIESYSLKLSRPSYLANKLLYRLVYSGHPYMYYDATLKTLNNITLDDIKNSYGYINPKSAYVTVSGSYDDKILSILKEKLLNWKKEESQKAALISKDNVKSLDKNRDYIYLIHRDNSAQATIKYAQTTIPFSDKEFINLHIANQAFGGGATGRLFLRLREKESLTYGAYSGLSEKLQKGIFVVSTDVRNEVVGQAVNSILDELNKFKNGGITQEELDRVKSYETGKLSLKLEKLSAFNDELMKKHFFYLKNFNFIKEIESAKLSDINKTLGKIITPNKGIIVIVGDYKKIIKQLEKIGKVAVFDTNFKPINLK